MVRGVVERNDIRMFLKNGMHDLALDAGSAAMDDANLAKSTLDGLIQIFLDHNVDFLRLERVEVDGILDWDVVHGDSI